MTPWLGVFRRRLIARKQRRRRDQLGIIVTRSRPDDDDQVNVHPDVVSCGAELADARDRR